MRIRGAHIFYTIGSQMVIRLWTLCAGHALSHRKMGWVNPRARVQLEGLGKERKNNAFISIHTCDLLTCSTAPQPTTLLHAPRINTYFGQWKNTFMCHTQLENTTLCISISFHFALQYKCQRLSSLKRILKESVLWFCYSMQNSLPLNITNLTINICLKIQCTSNSCKPMSLPDG
jgi:hypothetical protein